MNVNLVKDKIIELGISHKTVASIVSDLHAIAPVFDSITFREAVNLNADHPDIGLAIQQILVSDAAPEIKYQASLFFKVMTEQSLDPIIINDDTTQKVLTELVNYGGTDSFFTQEMRDIVEAQATKNAFNSVNELIVNEALKMISPTEVFASSVSQEEDGQPYISNQGKHRIALTIPAIDYNDVISVIALDKMNGLPSYGLDKTVRARLIVKANESGTFTLAVNNSGLGDRVSYVVKSLYERSLDATVSKVA